MRRVVFIIIAIVLGACGPSTRNADDDGDDGDDGGTPDADPSVTPDAPRCEKMDVLFVIDNSGSMGQEQANLIANFPMFIQVLDQSGLDYRVGVTTSGRNYSYTMETPIGPLPMSQDGGDDGRLLQPPSCGMPRRWLEKTDPNVSQMFSCVANVGTSGPSDEMPLSAMRDAFEERIADGYNAGFLRPDALLAVVLLTDEEDCSYEQSVNLPFATSLCDVMTEPVGNYVTFLDQLTGSRGRWATAVIAGMGPGSCSSPLGDAAEATRLINFVTATGVNAIGSSICDGDLAGALGEALDVFQSACAAFPPIE